MPLSTRMAAGAAVRTKPSATSTPVVQLSDLPSDMLGTVCSNLTGLHRIRFAATCKSWRAAAVASRHLAPPSLPWFLYSDDDDKTEKRRLYCPEYGSVLSMVLRIDTPDNKQVLGFHGGGWAALLSEDMQLAIVNLFSGTEVPLSAKQKQVAFNLFPATATEAALYTNGNRISFCGYHRDPRVIRKIIFSESPTSEISDVAMAPYVYKWEEVTSLGQYALFLGKGWSKAMYVPPGGRGWVRRNYIYTDGVVYSMTTDQVCHVHDGGDGLQMIKSAESYLAGGPQGGIWLPPPDF